MYNAQQRELATLVHEASLRTARDNPHQSVNKELMMRLGQVIWPLSYAKAETDDEAARHLLETANQGLVAGDPYWTLVGAELLLPQNQIVYSGSALWCHQGFPQIVMGHKYAAALMATKLSKDVMAVIQPPWRAFYIEVPHGLIYAYDNIANRESSVRGVLVMHMDYRPDGSKRWAYYAITDTQVTIWRHGATSELLVDAFNKGVWDGEPFVEEFEDLDMRCASMIGRLILNVCLAFGDPNNVKAPKPSGKKKGKHNERESSEPRVRTYQLGGTPSVDCREAVANYMRTGRAGSQLNVQVMVAGHWKLQPHGPGNTLRRATQILPYWRGPDDAPILVKPRVIKENEP